MKTLVSQMQTEIYVISKSYNSSRFLKNFRISFEWGIYMAYANIFDRYSFVMQFPFRSPGCLGIEKNTKIVSKARWRRVVQDVVCSILNSNFSGRLKYTQLENSTPTDGMNCDRCRFIVANPLRSVVDMVIAWMACWRCFSLPCPGKK